MQWIPVLDVPRFRFQRASLQTSLPQTILLVAISLLVVAAGQARAADVDRSSPLACPGGTTTCLAGRIDNFATGDGPEFTAPGAALQTAMLLQCEGIVARFDSIPTDQCLGQRFAGCWTQDCVAGATLRMHVKGGPGSTDTDDLLFGEDAANIISSISLNILRSLNTGGSDTVWDPDDEMIIVLELGALPFGTVGSRDIISSLQDGDLDIVLNDDTMVDYIEITVANGSVPTLPSTWGSVRATYR